jgi:hypothetical protein
MRKKKVPEPDPDPQHCSSVWGTLPFEYLIKVWNHYETAYLAHCFLSSVHCGKKTLQMSLILRYCYQRVSVEDPGCLS